MFIGKKIGKGSFGCIFECKEGNVMKAIKKYNSGDDGTIITETERELGLLQELKNTHPNLIEIHDIYFDDETCYLVMKKYDCDLYDMIYRNVFISDHHKINMAYKLLHALAFLHKNNIIHRDIKPGNILMDGYEPVLADFGLAKYFNHKDRVNKFTHSSHVSTRTYRAPEICQHRKYNFVLDEWSLGIVLYELIENKLIQINKDAKLLKFIPTYIEILCNKTPIWAPLIKGLLTMQASKRMKAENALKLDIFKMCTSPIIKNNPRVFSWPTENDIESLIANVSIDDKNKHRFVLYKMFGETYQEMGDFLIENDIDVSNAKEYIEYEKSLLKKYDYNLYNILDDN